MKRRSRIGKIKGKGATVLPWMEMFLKRAVVELHTYKGLLGAE